MQTGVNNESVKVRVRMAAQLHNVRFVYDEQAYKALLKDRDTLRNSLEELNQSNRNLNEKLSVKSKEIEKQMDKFRQQIHVLQAENKHLRDIKKQKEEVIEKFAQRLDNFEKGSKLQAMAISNLSVEICQLKATNNGLVNQLEKVPNGKTDEESVMANSAKQLSSYKTQENGELRARLETLKNERDRLLGDRDEMNEWLEHLKSQLELAKKFVEMKEEAKLSLALKLENDKLKEGNEKLNKDLHCAKTDLTLVKQNLMMGKCLWENLKCEYEKLKGEKAKLIEELERTKSDYRVLKRQMAFLQRDTNVLPSLKFTNDEFVGEKLADSFKKREKPSIKVKKQAENILQTAHLTAA